MTFDGYELVHFNIAIAKQPLDHPEMEGFTRQLDAVNRLAAASPGFVWTPGRLYHLELHGPTPDAFTFTKAFSPTGDPA